MLSLFCREKYHQATQGPKYVYATGNNIVPITAINPKFL